MSQFPIFNLHFKYGLFNEQNVNYSEINDRFLFTSHINWLYKYNLSCSCHCRGEIIGVFLCVSLNWNDCVHTGDVKWPSTNLNSPVSRRIPQQFVYADKKQQKPKSSSPLALCHGNPSVTGGSPHKRPVRRKAFPCHDVIMLLSYHPSIVSLGTMSLYHQRWPRFENRMEQGHQRQIRPAQQ